MVKELSASYLDKAIWYGIYGFCAVKGLNYILMKNVFKKTMSQLELAKKLSNLSGSLESAEKKSNKVLEIGNYLRLTYIPPTLSKDLISGWQSPIIMQTNNSNNDDQNLKTLFCTSLYGQLSNKNLIAIHQLD